MRRLPLILTALVSAVAALPAHGAATPALDGKRVKTFAFSAAVSDPQAHPLAETAENPVDDEPLSDCPKPRCYAFPFTVAPAKGVNAKTPLSAQITWTMPTSRFWLVLVTDKKGEKARCSTFYVTAGQKATIRTSSIKPGRYEVWVTVQDLVAPDTVKGTVSFPATHTVAANPGPAGTELFVHGCNL
ncbi:MAG TPA: hypothetical protein VGX28_11780 [Frankiaceae bacterium]|nr:hypothetical protein [Frankiaceae bacterium]